MISSLTWGYAQRPGMLPGQRGYSARFEGPTSCSTFKNATAVAHLVILVNVEGLRAVASQYGPFDEFSIDVPGGRSAVLALQYEPVAASITTCSFTM